MRQPHLLNRVRQFVRLQMPGGEIIATTHPEHATQLAREAVNQGYAMVVAIGGDGTMHEVAAALVNTPTTLGLIPCGSGNGLGRHLGIPRPDQHAFDTLLQGEVKVMDTGIVNGHPFFNVMGLGFDAEISTQFARLARRGFLAYIRTACLAWRRYQPAVVTIQASGRTVSTRALLLAVANSDQYGNNCYIAPSARIDDGLLDLTILQPVNLLQALPLVARLFSRSVHRSKHALTLRAERFEIRRAKPGLVHVDGESFEAESLLTVQVRPASLRVLAPKSA